MDHDLADTFTARQIAFLLWRRRIKSLMLEIIAILNACDGRTND